MMFKVKIQVPEGPLYNKARAVMNELKSMMARPITGRYIMSVEARGFDKVDSLDYFELMRQLRAYGLFGVEAEFGGLILTEKKATKGERYVQVALTCSRQNPKKKGGEGNGKAEIRHLA